MNSDKGRFFLLSLAGLAFGAAGSVTHGYALGIFPVGLIVAFCAYVSFLFGIRMLFFRRAEILFFGVCACVSVFFLALPSSDGSVLIAGNFMGYAWLFGMFFVTSIFGAWPINFVSMSEKKRLSSTNANTLNVAVDARKEIELP